jgi:eukaryotic-like serine/threonine-protein kinase
MAPERPEPNDLAPGTVINDKFRVVSLLASGGMGRIYVAEQAPLGRAVALKVLRTPQTDTGSIANEFRKRFDREASILSKLQHVNVVTLFDYGRIEGAGTERYFMAMELLQGVTLAQKLRSEQLLTAQETLRIVRQIARGLREAHRMGAVHRDLKPSNVMLVAEEDGGEVVKILDFGIGKLADDDQEITQEGSFLGSPKYIAPEQVNERHVDARTDVYALGIIAFECLCGRVPFEGETNLETILAHYNKDLPRMAERNPGVVVPEVLEAFVRRCLKKDPAARPQSMEEVLRNVSECERQLFGSTSLGAVHGEVSPSSRAVLAPPVRHSEHATVALTPQPRPRPSVGTASPMTTSHGLPGPAPSSRTGIVIGLVAVAMLAAGAAAMRFATRDTPATASGATASTAPPVAPDPRSVVRSFTLLIDSKPAGADVLDGDDVIGTTPMQVTIERASVQNGPRRFVLRLDGYAPYTVLQGDADSTVQIAAPLAAVAPSASGAGSVPPRSAAPRWTAPTSPRPVPTPPHPPQEPDIKLQR